MHSMVSRTLTPTLDMIDVSRDEQEKRGREVLCRFGIRRGSFGCRK